MENLWDVPNDDPIAARFAKFDAAHPEVYASYKRFAYELKRAGCTRGSTQQILGRVRWESNVNPGRDGGWKVNEQFKKHYALKLVGEDPTFEGFFEFREFSGRES
jgi:hypothetical protein